MEKKLPDLSSGIKVHPGGGMTLTGDGIDTYRNLLTYTSLNLECLTSMRMTRGISAHQVAKRDFKTTGNKFTSFQQLGLKFVEYGYVLPAKHLKNLLELKDRKRITEEQYEKWAKELQKQVNG